MLGYNMFAYCNNSPVSNYDPNGYYVHTYNDKLSGLGIAEGIVDAGSGGGGFVPGCGGGTGRQKSLEIIQREIAYYNNTSEQVVLESDTIAFYYGVPVFRIDGDRSGSFGAIFLTRETNFRENPEDVVRHEYGHTKQLSQLGLINFALCIGLPSWLEWGTCESYYDRPWEVTADIYGRVQSRSPSLSTVCAGFDYLNLSKSFGILAWLTID